MKLLPIMSNDPKVLRVGRVLAGMVESSNNAVIFRDSPEVWFQFYLGIFLEKPTFVIILQKDMTTERRALFAYYKAHVTVVDAFTDATMKKFVAHIAVWVKNESHAD